MNDDRLSLPELARPDVAPTKPDSEARKTAMFQTALDSIISIDQQGRIVELNAAAERTFGYSRQEAEGRELAALIIPPSLRERHRRGMAHFLATGEGPILDQRIEMPAVRADGTEIAVELTVTRIPTDGPPLFTAFLRDITERKRSEQRLAIQYAVTRALADSATLKEAGTKVLCAVCEHLEWHLGALWYVDQALRVLRCSEVYHLPSIQVERFEAVSRQRTFAAGIGLPGRVWASGKAAWIPDVVQDENFPRAAIADAEGLHGAFASPIVMNGQVLGVIEFFSHVIRQPDEDLLQMMTAIGSQIGQFIERTLAEEALKKSEDRFARFMEHLPGLAWIKDGQGRYVYANDAAAKAFGTERAMLYGKTDEEIFPPGVAAQFTEHDRRALANGGDVQVVETLEHPDGVLHHSVVSKFPIPAPDGHTTLVGGMAIDITARKHAEESLRESEERFRILADSSPVLIWVNGPDGCEFVNRTYREFLGVDAAHVRGYDWVEFVHPDDREAYLGGYLRAAEERAVLDTEFRFRRHDGQYRWMRSVGHPRYGPGGEYLGYVGSSVDVTDHKEAERTLRIRAQQQQAVAQLGELALRERDLQKVFDYTTAMVAERLEVEYCKILELLPGGEEVLLRAGIGWKEGLVGKATVGTGLDSHAGYTLLSDAPVIVTDLRAETRFSGSPLLVEHGVVSGMSCIIRGPDATPWGILGTHSSRVIAFTQDDVSFLVAAANIVGDAIHRERAEEALKEADRRKDEFLATLAHELRNPLAPLRNGLEVIKLARNDTEVVDRARTMMERQLRQMVHLIDDLLDLSRISRGKITLRKERMLLLVVMQQAIETSRPAIEQAGHELTISVPPEPIYVDVDPTRLAQVFSNLLNNAAKFTEQGGHVWLTIQRQGREAIVSVRDNGIGVPPDLLPKIFDMFTQIDPSLEHAGGGLGIGLALVKGLVEMHGGSVAAHSGGNAMGSEFVVRLPVVLPVVGEQAAGAAAPEELAIRRRILVVDDNRDAAISLAMILKIMGNETTTAHDGLEALDVAATFLPDVILLDIGMPKLNGYDAARRIREQPWGQDVVLVALTGWGQEDDRRRSQEAGFNFHLVKPVDPAALADLFLSERRSRTAIGGPPMRVSPIAVRPR